MNKKMKILIIVSIITVIAVLLMIWFYRTQTVWIDSEHYERKSNTNAKTLVVVYSRTGNTLSVAKEVAKYYDADLLKIEAPQYGRDIKGQQLAAKHADQEITSTDIKHKKVNLNDYEFIFLCSPTWWYRPAIPMWSFVENHDFANKSVFLIMTGNSRKKDEKTDKFKVLVENRNGNLLDILFVRRGRVFWQKTPEQLNKEVIEAIKKRSDINIKKK